MLFHKISKHQEILSFAADNPLPKTPEELALGLLDIATILRACNHSVSEHWSRMNLDIIYHGHARTHSGAFLSNPALLLNTSRLSVGGASHASYGAGCFFAYAHYQEDSLGPALLLPAFSPRNQKPKLPVRLYAKALIHLRSSGLILGATLSSGSDEITLEKVAEGKVAASALKHVFIGMDLAPMHFMPLTYLRTELAAKAVKLALSDDKLWLFTDAARARLSELVTACAARSELEALSKHIQPDGLQVQTRNLKSHNPRI